MNLPDTILHNIPWDQSSNPIWPASCFFLHRNLSDYSFPSKLSPEQSSKLLEELKTVFLNLQELKDPSYLPAEILSAQEKEFLCEHFLGQEGWQNASKGQAFIFDSSAKFLALLNFQDHLLLQLIDCKGEWEQAWNSLNKIEESIGAKLAYAFCPRFGYLTSNPKRSGLGLLAVCYLHLPGLIRSKTLIDTLKVDPNPGIEALGLLGNMDEMVGDFLVLKNNYTIGLTEEAILNDLYKTASYLILSEKAQRLQYKETNSPEIKDAISRAYGLLMHSYQLETQEALNALSQIKLGIDLGWVTGISDEEINEIFFRCRRAHIAQSDQKISLNEKELAHARAEHLHGKLKKITLTF